MTVLLSVYEEKLAKIEYRGRLNKCVNVGEMLLINSICSDVIGKRDNAST